MASEVGLSQQQAQDLVIDMGEAPGFSMGDAFVRPFSGESLTFSRGDAPKGTKVPAHSHPHEQIAFLEKGRLLIAIAGNEPVEVRAGQIVHLPSNVSHGVEFLEDSVLWDVFNPVRDDFMEMARAAQEG